MSVPEKTSKPDHDCLNGQTSSVIACTSASSRSGDGCSPRFCSPTRFRPRLRMPRARARSLTEDRQSWKLVAGASWELNELSWRDHISDTCGVSVLLYNRPARAIGRVRVGEVLLSRTTGAAGVLHAVHVHDAIGVQ